MIVPFNNEKFIIELNRKLVIKKAIKDGLPEDAEKDAEANVQKVHDKFIKEIDERVAAKEKEIMTV